MATFFKFGAVLVFLIPIWIGAIKKVKMYGI